LQGTRYEKYVHGARKKLHTNQPQVLRQSFGNVTHAFIQNGDGVPNLRAYMGLCLEFSKRGIEVSRFTTDIIPDIFHLLSKTSIVVGGLNEVHSALQALSLPLPPSLDYPTELQPFLCRKVLTITVQEVISHFQTSKTSLFIKPQTRKEGGHSGLVAHDEKCIILQTLPTESILWCSEMVTWIAEFRVFVVHGKIVGITQYSGEKVFDRLNINRILEAISAFEKGYKQAAYALDFGILGDGQTALVEWTDAYSVGSYGLESDVYADFLLTRWLELVGK